MRLNPHSKVELRTSLPSQGSFANDHPSIPPRHASHVSAPITNYRLPITAHQLPITKSAFTLIELILVMTILAIAISFTAPALANFFRGRSLDYEARRLLSLTRQAQSRAASEGLPMEIWFDSSKSAYGLEAEPSYEPVDSKAVSYTLDSQMQIELSTLSSSTALSNSGMTSSITSTATPMSNHPGLPKIRFLPDGSISENSPQMLHLIGRDGMSLWLVLSRNRLNYEIRARNN